MYPIQYWAAGSSKRTEAGSRDGIGRPRGWASAIFNTDETRSRRSVMSKTAAKYHIREMRRAAWADVESPLIMAEIAALLLSIRNVKERDFKRYRSGEVAATAVTTPRQNVTDVSLKQSMSPAAAVLLSRAINPAAGREECGPDAPAK